MKNLKNSIKRICAVSLAVLMLGGSAVTVLPEVAENGIVAQAADWEMYTTDDGFLWRENNEGNVTIIGYHGESLDVRIPSTINGKVVTEIDIGELPPCGFYNGTSLFIPDSVTNIVTSTYLTYIRSLTSIVVDRNNKHYSSENGVVFNKDKSVLVIYPAGKKGAYTIPNSVKEIGSFSFSGCEDLTSVKISNSVIGIGRHAFCGCKKLKNIKIPNSVMNTCNCFREEFENQ